MNEACILGCLGAHLIGTRAAQQKGPNLYESTLLENVDKNINRLVTPKAVAKVELWLNKPS
jgi:hypothetical protein